MIKKLPTKSFLALAGGLFLLNSQAGATVIIQNEFDGSTGIGSLQTLSNDVGGTGTFDETTGLIQTSGGTNNTTGFNTATLINLDPSIDTITATFVVTSGDVDVVSANGIFLGLVTGTNATSQVGAGLFNNDPSAFGLHLLDNGINANSGITQNNVFLGDTITVSDLSLDDGFTFTLTLNSDDTFDAVTTGLSTNINLTGESFGATAPDFNDFLTGGIGVNSTIQSTGATQTGTASLTFDSVTLEATTAPIPEPSSAVILVGGLGCLALRRRRQK